MKDMREKLVRECRKQSREGERAQQEHDSRQSLLVASSSSCKGSLESMICLKPPSFSPIGARGLDHWLRMV